MSQALYNDLCGRLEDLPLDYTGKRVEVQDNLKKFVIGIDRRDVAKTPENIKRFMQTLRLSKYSLKGNIPRFSQIVDSAYAEYKKSGWKYTEEFLDHQRLFGGKLYSVVVNIGDKPLYSKRTVEIALKAVKKVVKDRPAYWKIERNDSLKNNIHVHILILVDEGHKFPKKVNNFPVASPIELGSQEEYKNKTNFENVRDLMVYLYKPADGRASFHHMENVQQMYLEWWEEMLCTDLDGKPRWERVALRGSLNLNVKWLKGYDREEIEGRYISMSEESIESENPVPVRDLPMIGEILSDLPLLFPDASRIYSRLPP